MFQQFMPVLKKLKILLAGVANIKLIICVK